MITRHNPLTPSPAPQPMLRWMFQRGRRTLTCGIDVHGRHDFEVNVVPDWDVSATVIERRADVISAMAYHAVLARALRAAGWVVVKRRNTEAAVRAYNHPRCAALVRQPRPSGDALANSARR